MTPVPRILLLRCRHIDSPLLRICPLKPPRALGAKTACENVMENYKSSSSPFGLLSYAIVVALTNSLYQKGRTMHIFLIDMQLNFQGYLLPLPCPSPYSSPAFRISISYMACLSDISSWNSYGRLCLMSL
ncbi:hypothetical protein H112_07441 [Trichophyton rubrum D6]|uniref:Uncharacterized protein n=3 Tax=Trichophyton TaxID=5550 RepID=A0A087PFE4_TRIRC|nr:uncharacterized protein TERG_11510 [Trichophyton rubrum CBS 118892]EZF11421.1 hypothetical protein H100_07467 [Trichophyton rubrum MR850]EZF38266.1 hypothetical protein H102_07431 [Trichophyton rubrum CBS 100081]EZF48883.1 hypothetical protein H103_07455 [Trichophyton rubrum CBS 288.86]EZF59532.1 hypothetical protein H104_07403 [Trichophyton rubrum CBS 289.86]EZF70168.1 hypothetical protein H105_07461 [Trichophyton soudanense CBS 452.61]EZF80766.1 hypothetical protein H110_07450 [Trichophy